MSIYRLAPCPVYDIESTESWLESMASKGFLLNGFFAGVATFERADPVSVRYRLDAAPKSTSIWSDNGGIPDAEMRSLHQSYGWSYITNRGPFHIYASYDNTARELHTDPAIQAVTLDIVRRQERGNLICIIFWLMLYPLFLQGGFYVLITAYALGMPRFLLGAFLALWALLGACKRVFSLRRLRNRLAQGETPNHHKSWHRYALCRQLLTFVFSILCLIWVASLFTLLSERTAGRIYMPSESFEEELPFATMKELALEGAVLPAKTELTRTVIEDPNWLMPVAISLRETGSIRLNDGLLLEGGLHIDYFETRSHWLAMELAREYRSFDKRKNRRYFKELSLPALDTDYAAAYHALFPTLLMVDKNRVIRITFYQTSANYTMPLEEWAKTAAKYFIHSSDMKGDYYE